MACPSRTLFQLLSVEMVDNRSVVLFWGQLLSLDKTVEF